jgi:hypothetical protein
MKIQTNIIREIELTFTVEEASMLRDFLQNPLLEEEMQSEAVIRARVFDALNTFLKGV